MQLAVSCSLLHGRLYEVSDAQMPVEASARLAFAYLRALRPAKRRAASASDVRKARSGKGTQSEAGAAQGAGPGGLLRRREVRLEVGGRGVLVTEPDGGVAASERSLSLSVV